MNALADIAGRANRYVNGVLQYDRSAMGQNANQLANNLADPNGNDPSNARCFNYVKDKANTLLMGGVPRESLKVMQGLYETQNGKVPHSVLLVDDGSGDPLILDNYVQDMKRLSERPELHGYEVIPIPEQVTGR